MQKVSRVETYHTDRRYALPSLSVPALITGVRGGIFLLPPSGMGKRKIPKSPERASPIEPPEGGLKEGKDQVYGV